MPYRIDIVDPSDDAIDQLVQLGALDIEQTNDGLAAIVPDSVTPEAVADALGGARITASPAIPRDDESVWLLSPRAVRVGSILVTPPGDAVSGDALRLSNTLAFGSGHHPTTALCVEAIEETLVAGIPESMLDVGTGSGVLALAALKLGVPRAVGLDIDASSLEIAAGHARLNQLEDRLDLVLGDPGAVSGSWPLVVANMLAAPLIEMGPILVRRVGHGGRIILSGIPWSVESDVRRTYEHLGMRFIRSETRAGWTIIVLQASW